MRPGSFSSASRRRRASAASVLADRARPRASAASVLADRVGDYFEQQASSPYMLIVAGHPAADARVPVIGKKSLDEISEFLE